MTSELPDTRKSRFVKYGAVILILAVLTFLAVRPSFNLALSGDDWIYQYIIWNIFEVNRDQSYFNPLTYLCSYCPHYLPLLIIKFFWGFNPFYYYLVSYFTRVIAAISIFLLVKRLAKKDSLALLASIFFSVNYLGIETTDWVFNMTHYIGIAIIGLFIYSYWVAQNTAKYKHMLMPILLFAGGLVVSPTRMHGLFPLILLSEIVWFLIQREKPNFKKVLTRILAIFIIYEFIYTGLEKIEKILRGIFFQFDGNFITNKYGTSMYFQMVGEGLSKAKIMFTNGQSDFIINPIATLGNYILPDRLWGIFPHVVPIALLFTLISILILKLYGIKRRVLVFYTLSLVMWVFFIYMLWKVNPNTFLMPKIAFSLIGGFSTFFTIVLFFLIKKNLPVIAYLFAIAFGWMNTFSLFPHLLEPYGIIFTWGRYSIQQGAGLSIWISIIIYLVIKALKEKKLYSYLGLPYSFAVAFFVMHLIFTNNYLSHVATYRNVELDKKFWNKITTDVPKIDQNSLSIFYLVSHPNAYEAAEAFRFGFYGRPAMFYNFTGDELLNPLTIFNDYQALLSSAYDGTYFTKKLGRAKEKIALGNIYAFYFDENNQLSNITEIVRQKLTEDMEALNKGTLNLPQ